MKAIYENHYLTDRDVANYARQSFAKLAENFSDKDNNNLVRFLARGMATKDWAGLIEELKLAKSTEEAIELAVYLRKIPEHWSPTHHSAHASSNPNPCSVL
jgi:thymidylate synthase (FAD)